jgi:hypothetical protein
VARKRQPCLPQDLCNNALSMRHARHEATVSSGSFISVDAIIWTPAVAAALLVAEF